MEEFNHELVWRIQLAEINTYGLQCTYDHLSLAL